MINSRLQTTLTMVGMLLGAARMRSMKNSVSKHMQHSIIDLEGCSHRRDRTKAKNLESMAVVPHRWANQGMALV